MRGADPALEALDYIQQLDARGRRVTARHSRLSGEHVEAPLGHVTERWRRLVFEGRQHINASMYEVADFALPRHQTLRASLEWSHELLSEPERVLFRRLAVFSGGWSIEAAEAICAGDGLPTDDILRLLGQLLDKSLVVASDPHGSARPARSCAPGACMTYACLNSSGTRPCVSRSARSSHASALACKAREAFDTAGTRLLTASEDGSARVWDVATGRDLLTLAGHSSGILTAAWFADGAPARSCPRSFSVPLLQS